VADSGGKDLKREKKGRKKTGFEEGQRKQQKRKKEYISPRGKCFPAPGWVHIGNKKTLLKINGQEAETSVA